MVFAAIGGTAGQLLEQNAQALDQISANFAAFKVNIRYMHHVVELLMTSSIGKNESS